MDKPLLHGTPYRPFLLPETVEVAFHAIRNSLEESFAARRMRRLTAPSIVRATEADSFTFVCSGREGLFTFPSDLTRWKLGKMKRYGIGAGYGIYTYIRTVNPMAELSPVTGHTGDRLECMRNIEPDTPATATLIAGLRWLYQAVADASGVVKRMFPHIPQSLPAEMTVTAESADIPHECRINQGLGTLSEDGRAGSVWLWSDIAGMSVKIGSLSFIEGKYLAGWCSPALVAMILLRQASIEEIFGSAAEEE